MIKKIRTQNTDYFYVTDPQNDDISSYGPIHEENLYTKFNTTTIENVRLILVPNVISKEKGHYLLYLYWGETKNLEALDARVLDGNYDEEDFINAIPTIYKEGITCFNCNQKFNGLEVDHGFPYIGDKELFRQKMDFIFKNKLNLKCPNCNNDLRITILKFI